MICCGLFSLIEEASLFVKVWLFREFTRRIIVAVWVCPPIDLDVKSLSNLLFIDWCIMVALCRVLDHLGVSSISLSGCLYIGLVSPYQKFRFLGFYNWQSYVLRLSHHHRGITVFASMALIEHFLKIFWLHIWPLCSFLIRLMCEKWAMLRLGCLLSLKQDLVPHLDDRGDLDVGGQAVAWFHLQKA